MKAQIIGVQAIMKSLKFYFGSQLGERLLGQTDNLSRTLQNRDLSAMDAISLAEVVIKTLEKERSENQFELFWKKINKIKKKLCINDPIVQRKKKKEIAEGSGKFSWVFCFQRTSPKERRG